MQPTAVDEWGNNIPILRYTDVKLMYAEALNELVMLLIYLPIYCQLSMT